MTMFFAQYCVVCLSLAWIAAGTSALVNLRIEPDPTSFRFEGELGYLFEGEDGNLTCAPNASNLNVTWLYTTASGDQLPNVSAVGSTLVITAAPLSLNNEEVTCVAENGTANATTSYLLRVVGNPGFLSTPSNQTVSGGQTLNLTCVAVGLPTTPTVTWTMKRLDGSLTLVGAGVVGESLVFNVTDDATGIYQCTATIGSSTAASQPFYVLVKMPPDLTHTFAGGNFTNGTANVVLPCEARGFPTPVITWTRDGDPLQEYPPRVTVGPEGNLTFAVILLEDAGEYQCNASNTLNFELSDNATVDVCVPPTFKVLPISEKKNLNTSHEFMCEADGVPPPRYSWYKDGEPIISSGSRVTIVANGSLLIQSVAREDAGMYNCVVESDCDESEIFSPNANLTVWAPPLEPVIDRVEVGSRWLTVFWNHSSNSEPPVKHFRVEHRRNRSESSVTTMWNNDTSSTTVYNITGLLPHALYDIRVMAVSSFGEGTSGIVTRRTCSGVPSDSPENITVVPYVTSLLISWDIPADFTSYNHTKITWAASGGMSVGWASSETSPLVIPSLTPATSYNLSLSFVAVGGFEGPASTIESSTLNGEPTQVQVIVVNSTALMLSWQPLAVGPGPIDPVQHYTVQYNCSTCTYSDSSDSTTTRNLTTEVEIVVDANRTSVVIGGLRPYTLYSLRVSGSTQGFPGSFSDPVVERTFGDVPDTVVSVTGLLPSGPNSLTLAWAPPDLTSLNGPQEGLYYVINVSRSGSDAHAAGVPPWSNVTQKQLNGSLEYEVEGLVPFTSYSVRIAVANANGTGPFSNATQNRTSEDVPGAPAGVSVGGVTSYSVEVEWQAPLEPNGVVTSYNASILEAGGSDGGDGGGLVRVVQSQQVSGDVRNTTFKGLARATSYLAAVFASTSVGEGVALNQSFVTLEGNANYTPSVISVPPQSNSSMLVTWTRPSYENLTGELLGYTLRWRKKEEEGGSVGEAKWIYRNYTVECATMECATVVDGLSPYTEYWFSVAVMTTVELGPFSEPVSNVTLEAPPGDPSDLSLTARLPTELGFTWDPPSSPKGIITSYNASCWQGMDRLIQSDLVPSAPSPLSSVCRGLEPDTPYNITVTAYNGAGEGSPALLESSTACSPVPSVGEDLTVGVGTEDDCSIEYSYLLVLVQEAVEGARNLSSYSLEELYNSTKHFSAGTRGRRAEPPPAAVYIAANLTSSQLEGEGEGEGEGFVLGDGKEYGGFANHMLKDGKDYNVGLWFSVPGTSTPVVAVYAMTVATATDGTPTTDDPTGAEPTEFPLWIIIACGGVALGLAVAIIVMIVVIACCCYRSSSSDKYDLPPVVMERGGSIRLSSRKKPMDPVDQYRAQIRSEVLEMHPPIPVAGFVNRMHMMRANDNQLFVEEFNSIEMNPQHPTNAALLPENNDKNRYTNILPYDHSRVKLSTLKGQAHSDYINANFCDGYMKKGMYIATQGPLPDTIPDFWRMVWEENCRTIVMLTNLQEKGKIKCAQYWPMEPGKIALYGSIEVSFTSCVQLVDYTIRKFSIQKIGSGKDSKEVWQFHFTSWPDHGVPVFATAMLTLLRRVRSYHPLNSGPMVVHCSAGVGRSGTFIVVDSMLQRMKQGDQDTSVDIYAHVSLLRNQRNYMVQTEDQYFFIYEAVAESIVCGNTEMAIEKFADYIDHLYKPWPEDNIDSTYIEMEFKKLAVERNDLHHFTSANQGPNKNKNRYVNVLPYENNRVVLDFIRGVEGSDYINASYVDSYCQQKAFIATQGPLQTTAGDFWRMVWHYKSPVIVMLTQLVERGTEKCVQYWPGELQAPVTHGDLTVEMTCERANNDYVYREFTVTSEMQPSTHHLVRQLHFLAWPEVGVPASELTFVTFLRELQKLYATLNTRNPIVVHCSNGVGRTGVFIALHIILERMLAERVVDVFQTVKTLRIQRPAMVQSLDQYQFTYDAALEYLDTSRLLLLQQQQTPQHNTAAHGHHYQRSNSKRIGGGSKSPNHGNGDSFSKKEGRGGGGGSNSNPPSRGGSLNRKTSFKAAAQNNSHSHVYGESEATSTFATAAGNSSSSRASPPSPPEDCFAPVVTLDQAPESSNV